MNTFSCGLVLLMLNIFSPFKNTISYMSLLSTTNDG